MFGPIRPLLLAHTVLRLQHLNLLLTKINEALLVGAFFMVDKYLHEYPRAVLHRL